MPRYAIDQRRDMLVEFKSEKDLDAAQRFILNSEDIMSSDHDPDDGYHLYKPVHFTTAHKWVKDGYPHDTGLWVDTNWNGTRIIRYAKDDPNGY